MHVKHRTGALPRTPGYFHQEEESLNQICFFFSENTPAGGIQIKMLKALLDVGL